MEFIIYLKNKKNVLNLLPIFKMYVCNVISASAAYSTDGHKFAIASYNE